MISFGNLEAPDVQASAREQRTLELASFPATSEGGSQIKLVLKTPFSGPSKKFWGKKKN
jgi:hypothetical protein